MEQFYYKSWIIRKSWKVWSKVCHEIFMIWEEILLSWEWKEECYSYHSRESYTKCFPWWTTILWTSDIWKHMWLKWLYKLICNTIESQHLIFQVIAEKIGLNFFKIWICLHDKESKEVDWYFPTLLFSLFSQEIYRVWFTLIDKWCQVKTHIK